MRNVIRALAALLLLPLLLLAGFLATGPAPEVRAGQLLERQLALWNDLDARERSIASLRAANPEWDFMRRTFLGLAAADIGLADPARKPEMLALLDSLIDQTLADEAAYGHTWFLLPYATHRPWIDPRQRSLFVDGELAQLLGARRFLDDDPRIASLHRARVARVAESFARSPRGLPESYPDEVWLFCVTNALVGVRMADVLDGTDHDALIRRFIDDLPLLVEPTTGLLASEVTTAGRMLDGPEGSSLWLVATNLLVLDHDAAHTQYDGATTALHRSLVGFGWAREWGSGWQGPVDVDSGPIVPILQASPSSSGFALLASRAFDDGRTHATLARSLRAADLLQVLDPRLAALAESPMGDVILLHALTHGPLWARLMPPGDRS